MEFWVSIKGYPDYMVSNKGNIKSVRTSTEKLLKKLPHPRGYHIVCLRPKSSKRPKSLTVHRLVGTHFVANPLSKPHINHKDGDKLNNDSTNLEWCTPKENTSHAMSIGLM